MASRILVLDGPGIHLPVAGAFSILGERASTQKLRIGVPYENMSLLEIKVQVLAGMRQLLPPQVYAERERS